MIHQRFAHEPPIGTSSALISVAMHALIISFAIIETLPSTALEAGAPAHRLQYFPPPNPVRSTPMPEKLQYVELPSPTPDAGFRYSEYIKPQPAVAPKSATDAPPEPPAAPAVADSVDLVTAAREDSAFTEIEVDVPVARVPNSAAPAYPQQLLKNGIEGDVIARYVVDSTGLADTTTLTIVSASRPEFAEAVRQALPGMRFSSAKMGEHQVRQLVEQSFAFHIKRQ